MGIDSRVEQSDSVFLSSSKVHFELLAEALPGVGAVDECSLERWWCSLSGGVPKSRCSFVTPVSEIQNTKIFVIVGCGRTVDDQGPQKSVTILLNEMRVIPGLGELAFSS
jgi:hypothetical protein